MNKTISRLVVTALILASVSLAEAQQRAKIYRIGVLEVGIHPPSSAPLSPNLEALRQRLHELGWVEGQNIAFERRYAEGKPERLAEVAAELVRLKVDIIVSGSTRGTLAAKSATTTIPIVMTNSGDAVRSGLVQSLARPGGNVTGLTNISPELSGKRLELLKEAFPGVSRVAFLWIPSNPGHQIALKETEAAAHGLGLQLQPLEFHKPDDLERTFSAMAKGRADALLVLSDAFMNQQRKRLVALAGKTRIPAMFPEPTFAEVGGLMSYGGVSTPDQFRRAAIYVDKILKGAKPADLPVEQPMKFELVINLKTAKQIGLTIPPNVLARADKVIR